MGREAVFCSKLTVPPRGTLSDAPLAGADEDDDVNLTTLRVFWYDAAWRAIAEDVDDDVGSTVHGVVDGLNTVPGIDRRIQQFFGLRGGGVNDAMYRREDRPVYRAQINDKSEYA